MSKLSKWMTLTLRCRETTSADFKWRLRLGRENPTLKELKVPLTKLSNPITLRLADGDSSSTLTHRTVPLQLHIGNHVETVSFYVTSLCHGLLLGYSWLERHNPRINWVSRMVDFDSPYCLENCSAGSTRTQGLGKPPAVDNILSSNPDPMEPCVQDVSDLEKSLPSGPVSTWTLDSIHSDVYPFLDASPDSNSSVPDDIFKEFTSVFSKKQSEKLPIHREFDCTIDLVPNAAPHHGKIYQLTREEDKVMQDWIAENLAKGFIRNSSSPHGAPCFFVKQKDKLRLCMDYRDLTRTPSRIGIRSLSYQKCSGLSPLERSSLLGPTRSLQSSAN
ncbi:hypothetical protein BASA81_012283 [Batrachochytrium salamandrivorans]|nr:hypothetical protein BASA81_012283 [Batrachochytrium salamandrivorans]